MKNMTIDEFVRKLIQYEGIEVEALHQPKGTSRMDFEEIRTQIYPWIKKTEPDDAEDTGTVIKMDLPEKSFATRSLNPVSSAKCFDCIRSWQGVCFGFFKRSTP